MTAKRLGRTHITRLVSVEPEIKTFIYGKEVTLFNGELSKNTTAI